MATSDTTQDRSADQSSRPRWVDHRAANQEDLDQQIFSAGYNGDVVRRFFSFVSPYRNVLIIGIIAVIIFALSVLALPWIIRTTVNDVLDITLRDTSNARNILFIMVGLFFGAVALHVIVGYIQNIIVGRIAEHILIDLRRAMYEHLQRVSMSFMDKTEVGRMMSRLQGDVAALQEFLETAVISIGDFLLLFGIVIAMLIMDWRSGSADVCGSLYTRYRTRGVAPDSTSSILVFPANRVYHEWRARGEHQRGQSSAGDEPRACEP